MVACSTNMQILSVDEIQNLGTEEAKTMVDSSLCYITLNMQGNYMKKTVSSYGSILITIQK